MAMLRILFLLNLASFLALRMNHESLQTHGIHENYSSSDFEFIANAPSPSRKAILNAFNGISFPDSLHGKNLLLIGDSNDRFLTECLCAYFGGEFKYLHSLEGPPQDNEHPEIVNGLGNTCDLDRYDATLVHLRHNGALSAEPSVPWHKEVMTSKHLAGNDIHTALNKTQIYSVTDLARFYWPTILQHISKRPINVMLQSSVWDSAYSTNYDADMLIKSSWLEHASTLVAAVKHMVQSEKVEHIVWRTNSNCPDAKKTKDKKKARYINSQSEAQANAVRTAVAEKESHWIGVELLDFAKHDAHASGECSHGVHYAASGYKVIADNLFDILAK